MVRESVTEVHLSRGPQNDKLRPWHKADRSVRVDSNKTGNQEIMDTNK